MAKDKNVHFANVSISVSYIFWSSLCEVNKACVLIVAKCRCGLERTEEQNFNKIKGGHSVDKVRFSCDFVQPTAASEVDLPASFLT